MLVTLRDELYGGSWKLMRDDFKARLKGKPRVVGIALGQEFRIRSHLARIQRLETLEARRKLDLADLIRGDPR